MISDVNGLQTQMRIVSTFLYTLVTTDSRNDAANADMVELQTRSAALGPLMKRLGSWLAVLGVDEFAARSSAAGEHAFALQKAAENAEFQMDEPEEALAAELAPSASLAWQRLHGDVSSQLMVDMVVNGEHERVPMALARGLATHPDATRRRAAYDGELAAWATVAVPLAAALNGAKGELAVLNRRRGFSSDLDPDLHANNVDRATVDAMTAAVVDSLPEFRRYFRAKANVLGHEQTAVVGPVRPGRQRGRGVVGACDRARTSTRSAASPTTSGAWRRALSTNTGSTPRSATVSTAARTARRSTPMSAV